MTTFLLSYPTSLSQRTLHDQTESAPLDRSALQAIRQDWLGLCDQVIRAGAHVFVVSPDHQADAERSQLTGLLQLGKLGCIYNWVRPGGANTPIFVHMPSSAAHAAAEEATLRRQLVPLGLEILTVSQPDIRQSMLVPIGKGRYLYMVAPGQAHTQHTELSGLWPLGARVLSVSVAPGRQHHAGVALHSRGGQTLLLLDPGSLVGTTITDINRFVGDKVEVLLLSAEDIAARATQALCVHGTVILPTGTSSTLRGHLWRRGFLLAEVNTATLSSDGGPRALAAEWRGFVPDEELGTYATQREPLFQRLVSEAEV